MRAINFANREHPSVTPPKGKTVNQVGSAGQIGGVVLLLIAEVDLEGDRQTAAHGACCLHQVNRLAVLSHDRNIALRQQVAYVNDSFHVSRAGSRGLESVGE